MSTEKPIGVLIIESGGDAGLTAHKLLYENNFINDYNIEPVSVDSDMHSPSHGHPCFYKVPYATETDDYLRTLKKLIERHHIKVILPTGDFDPKTLSPYRMELLQMKTIMAFSPDWVFDLFEDKFSLYLENTEVIHRTVLSPTNMEEHDFPWFAKPRYGVGSRGLRVLKNHQDVEALLNSDTEEYVFQPMLEGEQYTVDVLCSLQGVPLQAVTRKVFRLKGGSDAVCQVVEAPKMETIAMYLCEKYGIIGAACFEFMFDEYGVPKVIDAQPRLSGSHGVTARAGLNLPQEILKQVFGETFTRKRIRPVQVVRILEEVIVHD